MNTPITLKTKNGTLAVERRCETCGAPFLAPIKRAERGQARFCSLACAGAARRRAVDCTCLTCGTHFTVRQSAADKGEGRYCSPSCYREGQRGERVPLADRFWAKVNKDGPTPPHRPELGACWVWTGSSQPRGYGTVNIGGKNELAHRIAYRLEHGTVPARKHVLHACDNPPCVRPAHLFIGTQTDNNRDAWAKGRGVLPKPPKPSQRARGERTGAAKISDAQARDIFDRYHAGGVTQQALADEYGLNQRTISKITRGSSYRHLHNPTLEA